MKTETPERQNLLTKVRKLLALGTSPNAHEASAAMAKAHALMKAHGLTLTEAAASEVTKVVARSAARRTRWEMQLLLAVGKAFGTFPYIHRDEHGREVVSFVGTPVDAAVSAAAFAGLSKQVKAYGRAEHPGNQVAQTAWCLAYVCGLKSSIIEVPQSPGIQAYREQEGLAAPQKARRVSLDKEAFERGAAVRLDRNQMEAGPERLALTHR